MNAAWIFLPIQLDIPPHCIHSVLLILIRVLAGCIPATRHYIKVGFIFKKMMVIDKKSEDRWRFHPHIVEYLIQIYKSPYQDTGHTEVGIKTWLPLLRFLWWCFKTIVETIHFKVRDKMTCGSTRLLFSCFFFFLVSVEIAFLSSTNSTRSVQPLESSSFRRSVSLPMPEEMGAPVFTFVFWLAWSFGVSECVKLVNIRQKRFVE